jgi:hypothetical protein
MDRVLAGRMAREARSVTRSVNDLSRAVTGLGARARHDAPWDRRLPRRGPMRRAVVLAALSLVSLGCAQHEDAAGRLPPDAGIADDPPYVPPPETCEANDLAHPERFTPCGTGGGVFGAWVVGDDGLPAYDYGLDENADDRARWTDSLDRDRREHWFAFGNGRVTALASNDGWISLTTQDRGMTHLAEVDEEKGAFGGGFSFVDDGEATWTTAYKWRPRGSRATRRFGSGWASASLLHRDVMVSRKTFAPSEQTFLVDEVTIENRSDRPRALRHYEYWDVRRRHVEIDWIVSGKPFVAAPATVAAKRDSRNAMFDERVTWDPGAKLLGLRRAHAPGVAAPPREAPSSIDHYPGDPFLAVIDGDASDVYTDDARFFGGGDPRMPAVVALRVPGEIASPDDAPRSGDGQPRMFAVRSDLSLAPGEKKTLRFAYGYVPMGAPWPGNLAEYKNPTRELPARLLHFASERDPFLHREMAWHASQLEQTVGYREYWGAHVVPQGSAYLHLHGADGALRDTALFAMPIVYTHRELAKEQLRLAMGLSYAAEARFSYAFEGHGMLSDALGLHSKPSDLDIFFLLAMVEYLGATGDVAFLDESVSAWPRAKENEAKVVDHVRRHVLHLLDDVGFGEHGLLRIGTGDWSDGIVATEAPNRDLAVAKGESVPNSQMAISVLPLVAALLEPRDAALAARIREAVTKLRAAVDATWAGSFYGRAYFGDGVLRKTKDVDLEAQVWPLVGAIGERPEAGDRARALAATIASELDDPSPIGAPLTKGGQVWPAIGQLLTWGYTRVDDERAWRHLAKSSLASRARAFPTVWFDVWSGPDGTGSKDGLTWSSPVTPMTDFPTMNANVHAMAMLAALRVAGVEPRADGVAVVPHVPATDAGSRLALRTALVDLDVERERMRVVWRPTAGVPRTIAVGAPRGAKLGEVKVGGVVRPMDPNATFVTLPVANDGAGVTVDATFVR